LDDRRSSIEIAASVSLVTRILCDWGDICSLAENRRRLEAAWVGDSAMFKGRAELVDPEKGTVVATFNETCHDNGTAAATVRLREPVTLQGTQRLEIFGTLTDQPMISVGASDLAATEIREFHGTSAIGCIPDETDVSLVKTPGGKLGTLLVVLGKGQIRRSY
jgi:hypothetical protein